MVAWINNSRIGRYLADILGSQAERLNFAISKLISVVVPLELVASEPQIISIAATAGNVITTISPKKGHRLELLYGRITLVTSADVADRYIRIEIRDKDSNVLAIPGSASAIAASLTKSLTIAPVGGASTNPDFYVWIAKALHIYGEDTLVINVTSGVAADSYSGFLKVLWL